MHSRVIQSRELADLFRLCAHPDRLRMIEQLRQGERDVTGIAKALAVPAARVSQHLALLRARRLTEDRRAGRNHFYRLVQPKLAVWALDALQFIAIRNWLDDADHSDSMRVRWSVQSLAAPH